MDDDEALSPENDSPPDYIDIKELMPANPIYDKPAKEQPKPVLRIEISKNQYNSKNPLRPVFKKQSESEEQYEDETPQQAQNAFENHYQTAKCVYKSVKNQQANSQGITKYYASCFIDKKLFKQNKQQLSSMSQLKRQILGQNQPEIEQPLSQLSQNEVKFNSNFESGNLFSVFKKTPVQYDLVLLNDINSRGNTQWFYFTVANLPLNVQITFNIVNFIKSDSLFNYGMQPVVLSETKLKKTGESWSRQGRCVSYYRNAIRREKSRRLYYTLTFKLTNKIANDVLHIAQCFPYTVTQLKEYMANLIKNTPKKGTVISRSIIGKSVGNNPIEVLTITDMPDRRPDLRKIIVVMARQHPGETQGSYVCEGVINFLVSKKGDWLRKNFIFKIIPMVNPDGVIFGNYRSNLMGFDLNRKWDVLDKQGSFPEVRCIKQFILDLNKEKRVRAIIDLHGHSKKLNSFFYGNPCPQHPQNVRGFPYTCAKLNSQITFQDCTFTIQDDKRKAARVYLSLKHNVINVYTFESSFYGYTKDGKRFPFGIQQFKGLGTTLMQAMHFFMEYDLLMEEKSLDKVALTQYHKNIQQLKDNPNLISLGQRKQSGSQSNPEEFQVKNEKLLGSIVNDSHEQGQDGISRQGNAIPLINTNPSRKGKRQIKQMIRNTRQLKVMQISRVNSVIPDKYSCQLALEPSSSIPCIPDQFDRKRSTLRQSYKDIKVNAQTQTNILQQEKWSEMRILDVDEIEQHPNITMDTSPGSIKLKDGLEIKYASLTSSRGRKHNPLRLDILSYKPLQSLLKTQAKTTYGTSNSSFFKTKSRATQTLLTWPNFSNKLKSITHFPSVDTTQERFQARQEARHHRQTFKSNRLSSKRDNQDFLNDMVRKYLISLKERTKTKPIIPPQDRLIAEKSLSIPNQNQNQRVLSIKKKDLIAPKKVHCKSRS